MQDCANQSFAVQIFEVQDFSILVPVVQVVASRDFAVLVAALQGSAFVIQISAAWDSAVQDSDVQESVVWDWAIHEVQGSAIPAARVSEVEEFVNLDTAVWGSVVRGSAAQDYVAPDPGVGT